jgi:esterase/lipase
MLFLLKAMASNRGIYKACYRILKFVFSFYLVVMLIVGRFLAFNDVFPRRIPDENFLKGYDYEKLEFTSFEGITLRGWFVKSKNNKSNRTLFLLHGWHGTRVDMLPYIELFVNSGFHVFAYDQRSHGESETAMITFGAAEGMDLIAAVKYISKRPDVDKEKIGAIGFSLGTGAIIYAVAYEKRPIFKEIILEGVYADSHDVGEFMLINNFGNIFGKFIGHAIFTVGTELWTLGKFKHSRPVDFISKISNTQLMIIRGENDQMVPDFSARKIINGAKIPKTIWITSQSKHMNAYMVYPNEYRSRVVGFLNSVQ